MNVLLSTWSLQIGGAEIFAVNLAQGLVDKNHRVYIFNENEHLIDEELIQRLSNTGVVVRSIGNYPLLNQVCWKINALIQRAGIRFSFHQFIKGWLLTCYIIKYKIDILSSHSIVSDRSCMKASKRTGTPWVITEHGEYTMLAKAGNNSILNILKATEKVVSVSNYCNQVLSRYQVQLKAPIKTIYNGVVLDEQSCDSVARKQLKIPDTAFVYGMVARGIPEKGWQYATQAFQQIQQAGATEVHLILVGASDYLDGLKKQCANNANIHFVGKSADPNFYIRAFDVGLTPTYFPAESLSLATIECLFHGKPVVATRIGGVPETLEYGDKRAGTLLELDEEGKPSVDDLREAMLSYLRVSTLYEEHADNTKLSLERFNMNTCVTQYEALFTELAK